MSLVTSAASRLVVIHDDDEGCGMKERNCTCLLCLKQLPYGLAASHINGTHELKAPDIRALFAQHGARLQPLFDRFLTAIRQRDRGVGEKAWNDLCTNTVSACRDAHIERLIAMRCSWWCRTSFHVRRTRSTKHARPRSDFMRSCAPPI
jgi:hypothetical protein